jgi:threonylcarbamoyladenosine tRNA methylthiotransferase MtaB
MMRIAFYTLGCKLNQAETESVAGRFREAGYELVAPDDMADIYITNTCTVTHIADRKSRHWLRLTRRRNPRALIIATGCYAQRAPQELAQLADLVLDNDEKERLLEIVRGLPLRAIGEATFIPHDASRVRSLIKIQDGCHSPCTYCIVPRVRPREYSLPASQIIEEILGKVAMGYKELVLTGTKIGCYKDAVLSAGEGSGAGLRDLVELVLHHTNIHRLRLTSLQPQEIFAEFLALWRDAVLSQSPEQREGTSEGSRLCRHFHLALQSGSDSVLQRMGRRYSLDDYQRALNLIKETIPGVAITTDIMVGFPGESDEEFEQSYHFCQQAGFASIHVFPFSPRPETVAAKMPDQVRDKVKKERTQRMLELSRICRYSFCQQFLGQIMSVLWEKETGPGSGIYSGLTDNYIRVFTQSQKPLTNKMAPVKLMGFHNQGMWGESV